MFKEHTVETCQKGSIYNNLKIKSSDSLFFICYNFICKNVD